MNKRESYKWAKAGIKKKVKDHINTISTLANTAAILKERFDYFFWVGFYFNRGDHLLLGPFQGPPACVRLSIDKGVCADCLKLGKPILVEDVHKYPGHIACDSRSNSEIVIPLFNAGGDLKAVLDVDSSDFSSFDKTDQEQLEEIVDILKSIWD